LNTMFATQNLPQEVFYDNINSSNPIIYTNFYQYSNWEEYLLDSSYSKNRFDRAQELLSNNVDDLTNWELLLILGDQPVIAQKSWIVFAGQTCAYITRESFGLGVIDLDSLDMIGICPI